MVTTTPAVELLHSAFLRSSELTPCATAIEVDAQALSYAEMRQRAAALAATLQRGTPSGGSPLTAVFAHRSATTFAGILGALMAGRGYVPLNRTFPTVRTRWMLQVADCRSVIADGASAEQLETVLEGVTTPLLVIVPGRDDVEDLASRWPSHTVLGSSAIEPAAAWTAQPQSSSDIAYLLFTSGSTGVPKGVAVTHGNVRHFVDVMADRYGITPADRFSQMFDTTFDLSVFDMFVAWEKGACVCCPPGQSLLNPDRFIRESKLTVWASVPSVPLLMKRFGMLRPGRYPSLRRSMFCGEPLPVDIAEAWAAAAPGSVVDNLYGPTELTVACCMYRWDRGRSAAESPLGIVPIGQPFPDMKALVVDEALREVAPGEVGELLMAGPQLSAGYWRNPEATTRSFVRPRGSDVVFYRTGDRVGRPVGDGPLTYVGRADHQVKVLGYRVELGEVESRLREEPGVLEAVALGWPTTSAGATGIAAFVTGTHVDAAAIRSSLTTKLQGYAVPHLVRVLPAMPQNANGKVDRQALLRLLEA